MDKIAEVHGFHNVAVYTELIAIEDVPLFLRGREHDDGDVLRSRIRLNSPQYFNAIDFRQLQIEEDHLRTLIYLSLGVGAGREHEVQSLGPILYNEYFAR